MMEEIIRVIKSQLSVGIGQWHSFLEVCISSGSEVCILKLDASRRASLGISGV